MKLLGHKASQRDVSVFQSICLSTVLLTKHPTPMQRKILSLKIEKILLKTTVEWSNYLSSCFPAR